MQLIEDIIQSNLMLDENTFADKKFLTSFWDWFDLLGKKDRDLFNYHPNDYAMLNFYNRIWIRNLNK